LIPPSRHRNDEHIGRKRARVRLDAFPSVLLFEMEVIRCPFEDLTKMANRSVALSHFASNLDGGINES
ncbi:MAG: hypothetical protein AAGK17_06300, partial [Pseudomonadota bacterium]